MSDFKGSQRLQTFAPGWSNPELLEKTLIGRRDLVDRLEELAIDGAGGVNKHQRLVVGVRGSGKTHVLKVLHNRLWANEEVKEKLLIAYLIEDELGVATFLDFVIRVLRAVMRWYPENEPLKRELDSLFELPIEAMEDRAVQLLLETAGDRDILILMENLGVLFDKKQGFGLPGQQALRDLVQQHPRFMLFATSQSLIWGIKDHHAPFFNFFSTTHLRKLTLPEARELFMAMARSYDEDKLVKHMNTAEGRGQVEAIYLFAGGNHRLLVSLFGYLDVDSLSKFSEHFIESLNSLRPFYQEQMRSLSAQQQKIVQYLSLEREPRTVKEIAQDCLAAPNTLSSQLKDLLDRRFVSRIAKGRDSYYELTETLFRVIYEADLEQGNAPVRLFADFLANFYTAKELQFRHLGYTMLAREKGNGGAIPFQVESKFYEQAMLKCQGLAKKTPSTDTEEGINASQFFARMQKEKAYHEIAMFAPHFGPSDDNAILDAEARAYKELGDPTKAREKALQALERDPDDVQAHLVLAEVYGDSDDTKDKALEHARRAHALQPEDSETMQCLGTALSNIGLHEEARGLFGKLTRLHPKSVTGWRLLGQEEESLRSTDAARKAYNRALDMEPKNGATLLRLAHLEYRAANYEEARDLFSRVTALGPNIALGWQFLGLAEAQLQHVDEARTAFNRALDIDPSNARALERRGVLEGDCGNWEEAGEFLRRLTLARPKYVRGWVLLGMAESALQRKDEARAAWGRALEIEPEDAGSLRLLGTLEGDSDNHSTACELFERLTRAQPQYADGWRLMGVALEELERRDEAKAAFSRVLDIEPSNVQALESLGILEGNSGNHSAACELFERLTRVQPDYANGWRLMAEALENLKRMDDARKALGKTLELEPHNVQALEILGTLEGNCGAYSTACELFERLTRAQPDYGHGWSLMGLALQALERLDEARMAFGKALEVEPDSADARAGLAIIEYNSGNYEAALGFFKRLTTEVPGRVEGWLYLGETLLGLHHAEEAVCAYQRALKINPDSSVVLGHLGSAKAELGRRDEALQLVDRALAIDDSNASALNVRGEIHRASGAYEAALKDYHRVIELESEHVCPYFNIVSASLALSRADDALTFLRQAFGVVDKTGEDDQVVQSLHENLEELFRHAGDSVLSAYLSPALDIIEEFGHLERFSQALSLTVFSLLKGHEEIELGRFERVVTVLEEAVAGRVDISVHLRFLRVGVDYFSKKDDRALLRLTREERQTFMEELDIDGP